MLPSQAFSVLVLDDEPAASTALAESGFAVTAVRTGEEAMDLIRERPFDLILLDMNVPGWNSLEGCSQIRKFTPGSKIIILAAVDADEDRVRALEAGADDCVNKPPPPAGVVARARAVLRHQSRQPERGAVGRRAS